MSFPDRDLTLRYLFAGAACLIASMAPAQTTYPAVEQARQRWEERLGKAGGKPTVSEYYPVEESLVFLTAYDFTRDPRYAEQAAKQLEYSHGREIDGLFLTTAGTTTRDYQARQIYNFYVAYRTLADGRYLKWADACAEAMVRVIPRRPHEHAGQTHTIFIGSFVRPDGTVAVENGETIDANQNSEIALAFTLLYHDPASKWFLSPVAKDIAYEELLAAMSIQNMDTGMLALPSTFQAATRRMGAMRPFHGCGVNCSGKIRRLRRMFKQQVSGSRRWLTSRKTRGGIIRRIRAVTFHTGKRTIARRCFGTRV